jgi:uncharacterized heparinase superfamily protein
VLPRASSRNPAAERAEARGSLPRAFPEGGYFLLGHRFGEPDEVVMTVDAGPLGYLGLAAHGHADALSLRLSAMGLPLLVDRGTFTYNTDPEWRRFFRGTLAHNTVTVDGQDQSEYGGPFLWLRKARSRVHAFASQDSAGHLDASHDGYRALRHGLVHRRRIDWHGSSRHFVVTDTLVGQGAHDVAIAWHFAPQCAVSLHGQRVTAQRGAVRVHLQVQQRETSGHWTRHVADNDSMLGWHSPSFGTRVPAASAVWRSGIHGSTTFVTRIDIQTMEEDSHATEDPGL